MKWLVVVWVMSTSLALAQPAANAQAEARVFLNKIDATKMVDGMLVLQRQAMIAKFEQLGMKSATATELTDRYFVPGLRARVPELISRFEGVLMQDFSPAELHAINNNEQNDSRRSAAAKAPTLQQRFRQVGQEWGQRVAQDVARVNADAIKQLELRDKR